MTMTAAELAALPRVPMSTFKTNPSRYVTTGAAVTTHGHISAAFIPVHDDTGPTPDAALEASKAQLRLLARLADAGTVAEELRQLSSSRDGEQVGEAR